MTEKPAYSEKADFNEWLDETYSETTAVELGVTPSLVLYELQYDQYELLEQDYLQGKRDALIDKVCNEYPFPIAHPFYRYLNGWENEHQRLNFMRDTWESTLHVIQTLAIGLCSAQNKKLAWKRVSTWSIGSRVKNCEDLLGGLIQAGQMDEDLQEAVSIIKDLNSDVRNEYSHSLSMSPDQALALVQENEPLLFEMLDSCDCLRDFQFLRFKNTVGSLNIHRYETFKSHASTPVFINVDTKELAFHFPLQYLTDKILIFKFGSDIFLASPLTHINTSSSGHQTHISLLRSVEDNDLKFQDVDGTSPYSLKQVDFEQLIALVADCAGEPSLEHVH